MPILDEKDDVELKPNMIIVLHPHVLMPSGGGIWISETFAIKSSGLNEAKPENVKALSDATRQYGG